MGRSLVSPELCRGALSTTTDAGLNARRNCLFLLVILPEPSKYFNKVLVVLKSFNYQACFVPFFIVLTRLILDKTFISNLEGGKWFGMFIEGF